MPNKQVRERGREILLNLYKHTEEPNCPICKDIDQALNRIMEEHEKDKKDWVRGIVPEENKIMRIILDISDYDLIIHIPEGWRKRFASKCRQLILERLGEKKGGKRWTMK